TTVKTMNRRMGEGLYDYADLKRHYRDIAVGHVYAPLRGVERFIAARRRAGSGRALHRPPLAIPLRAHSFVPEGEIMRALSYERPFYVSVEDKPDPHIEHPNDAVVRVTRSAICGSDLHLLHGLVADTRV